MSALDERVLFFKIAGTRIIVPVEIAGKEIEVALDTGAPDTLILSGQVARKLGISVEDLPEFGRGGTVLGPMEQRFHEAAEFRFAGFPYAPLPVIVAPRGLYNKGLGNDSLLGYDVLRPFVMRIDYANSRIWLKRTGDPRVTFLGADYATSKQLGAILIPDDKRFHVYYVAPGGVAARFGLRAGDAIVAAEGGKMPSIEDLIARVEARAELTVARRKATCGSTMPCPRLRRGARSRVVRCARFTAGAPPPRATNYLRGGDARAAAFVSSPVELTV